MDESPALHYETLVLARLCVLGSGSSGNCSVLEVLGTEGRSSRLLIDLGLSPRATRALLAQRGLRIEDIDAALLTHLDIDHCHPGWAGARAFGSEGDRISVIVHARHAHLARTRGLNPARLRTFDAPFAPCTGLTAFPLLAHHDQHGSVCYRFQITRHARRATLAYATDVGRVTPALLAHMRGAHVLAIESNYHPPLQLASDRPEFLKRRIMGGHGHLSNQQACEIIRASCARDDQAPDHVVLLHLSRDCNDRELVAREHAGARYALTIAHPREPTPWIDVPARPCALAHEPALPAAPACALVPAVANGGARVQGRTPVQVVRRTRTPSAPALQGLLGAW
jgi:phosphoribosyl 1,2-cyclic phosphodiesterase